ncbi:MAG: DUF481 domain-containing protein [Acidobacteriota bacterium]|nr:DUF481 domain-containing protein [Acidobacteriota bacterium]
MRPGRAPARRPGGDNRTDAARRGPGQHGEHARRRRGAGVGQHDRPQLLPPARQHGARHSRRRRSRPVRLGAPQRGIRPGRGGVDGRRGRPETSHQRHLPDVELLLHPAEREHQFNEFTRLEQRLLFGGGGRFQVLESPRAEVFLGTGYMLERETLDLPAELADARRSEHHRSTNYLTVRYNSRDERLRLVETLYFQTRFDRVEDYRVLSETSFEIQLLRGLALAINLNVAHDSEPPTGVKETDVVLSNSLRYSF